MRLEPAKTIPLVLALCVLESCRSSAGSAQASDGPEDHDPDPPPACVLVEQDYGPDGATPVKAVRVVSGLEVPWAIAFLPGGDMLVTERPGRLRLVSQGALVSDPVMTVPMPKGGFGEGGLLGLALHPDFSANGLFFVYYTHEEGGSPANRVARYRLAADHRTATFDRVILEGIHGHRFHDGGRLAIGPDRMLYVGTGDAGDPARSRDRASLNGKVLRVSPDGDVPADNPFPGSPVWLSGLRNTEGFDWLDDGTMLVADHGPSGELGRSGHDELNVARKGDDLGWPTIFGCDQQEGLVTPIVSWVQAVPPGGLVIDRGATIEAWKGSVLMGTLGSRHLHRFVLVDERVKSHEVYFRGDPPGGLGRLREVVLGPDGAIYAGTSNCDGRGTCPATKDEIVRIEPR